MYLRIQKIPVNTSNFALVSWVEPREINSVLRLRNFCQHEERRCNYISSDYVLYCTGILLISDAIGKQIMDVWEHIIVKKTNI
jgi:hypothetical protein